VCGVYYKDVICAAVFNYISHNIISACRPVAFERAKLLRHAKIAGAVKRHNLVCAVGR